MRHDAKGPYIVWMDYGCEGWQPRSYDTLLEAVSCETYSSDRVVTRLVHFAVIDMTADRR